MKALTSLRAQQNRIMAVVALVLLVALLLPQITLAAGPAAVPQFTCTAMGPGDAADHGASCDHYLGLLERYRSGSLEFHAPGR